MEQEIRTGWYIVLVGVVGFILWASFAPLDEGIPASGILASESSRKQVAHHAGGIIEHIAVKEGQRVKKGQTLLTLDETQSTSALKAAELQWWTALATEARLEAEMNHQFTLRTPEILQSELNNSDLKVILDTQRSVLKSRRSAAAGEIRLIRESQRGLETQLNSLQTLKSSRERQVALFSDQMASANALHLQGYVSKNQTLEIERQLTEVQSRQSEDLANINGIQARLAELKMRESQFHITQRRELEAELAELRRELGALSERVAMLRDVNQRQAIRAPVSGTVVAVAVTTVGGVIKPGDRVLDIVPDGDDLIVEARVEPRYIDRVRVGLPADLRFDAYVSSAQQPMVTGDVKVVSADVMNDERTGIAFYKIRVGIPADEKKRLNGLKMQPGMPCTVMIKTGERSLLAYLTQPLLRRFSGAMAES
jgi:HlyD family type I secretion membrane fusion protein